MAKTTTIWLMRELNDKQSMMFSIAVRVEREGDFFAATILNMEEHLAATGRDEGEALANARLLFRATVDDAFARGISIQFSTAQAPITIDLPVWMAPKFFHILEQKMLNADREDSPVWAIPGR